MKNLHFLLVTLICTACSSIRSQSHNEIQFNRFNNATKNEVSTQFDIIIKADSMQAASADGIKFSIKIHNNSEKAAKTVNPMDAFRLSLVNEKGINMLAPHNTRITVHALPETKFPFEVFNVLKIEVNGKQRNDKLDEISDIEIPGKGSYEIFFSIDKSLRPDASKPYKLEDREKLPKGRYTLSTGLSLSKDNSHQRFTASVKINYGL